MSNIRDFDETYEEFQSREDFETYFGSFSSDIRKRLISKNLVKPQNLYDVFYTKIKNELLSKNVSKSNDIEKQSEPIKDRLLSSNQHKEANLEGNSELIRKNLLSKNKLIGSTLDLDNISDSVRNNLLSKNKISLIDIEKNSDATRDNLLSKNVTNESDLERKSKNIREGLLSKNDNKISDLERQSKQYRDYFLAHNVPNNKQNIDSISDAIKEKNLASNVEKTTDLESSSETIKANLLSANKPNNTDLERTSEQIKNNLLSANVEKVSDLEKSSNQHKDNLLSKNNSNNTDLESLSKNFKDKNLSSNVSKESSLDNSSKSVRDNLLSANVSNENDLEKTSNQFKDNLLSKNDSNTTDLDSISKIDREKNLASNVSKTTDLEKTSQSSKNNLLSSNVPKNTDLDKLSEEPRTNLLSANVPNIHDLEKDGSPVKDSLLSKNVPNIHDLEADSQPAKDGLLSKNVPNVHDLEKESQPSKDGLLSKNIPNIHDLEKDGQPIKDSLLSKNVPNIHDLEKDGQSIKDSLLSKNVSNNSDLLKDSQAIENLLLSKNVPNNSDLLTDSQYIEANLLSKNTSNNSDLEKDSASIQNLLLSKNTSNSTDLLNDTEEFKNNLLSKNVSNNSNLETESEPFKNYLLSKNGSNVLGANASFAGTSTFLGVSNLETQGLAIRSIMTLKNKLFGTTSTLQKDYGLGVVDEHANTIQPKALITDAAFLFNVQQNTFALNPNNIGNQAMGDLLSHHTDGFQELLASSNNGLKNKFQPGTNSVPASIVTENNGKYLRSSPEESLNSGRFDANNPGIGTAPAMMAQTIPGDIIFQKEFSGRRRGVANIIDTIRNSNVILAKNYDAQNSKVYIVGSKKDGSLKRSFNRYTVANPYAPKGSGTLELKFKNYAIEKGAPDAVHTMSFPPYIKSFGHGDAANWTPVNFLGRPEALYTFNSASRTGSISFIVLTDFAQDVDMGYEFNEKNETEPVTKYTENFNNIDFVERDSDSIKRELESRIKKIKEEIAALNDYLNIIENDVPELNLTQKQIDDKKKEQDSLEKVLGEAQSSKRSASRHYSEEDAHYDNIMNNNFDREDGYKVLQPSDTKSILNDMKKNLKFQPAYFSGSKADFLTRMEFLSKMTRPSRNNGQGFSFIHPPVCHIHLGTWWNYDIIVNSVSYNYEGAPWTVGEKEVQPMWAEVTIDFNIIGSYGALKEEDTPLSSDNGGFFSRKTHSA